MRSNLFCFISTNTVHLECFLFAFGWNILRTLVTSGSKQKGRRGDTIFFFSLGVWMSGHNPVMIIICVGYVSDKFISCGFFTLEKSKLIF